MYREVVSAQLHWFMTFFQWKWLFLCLSLDFRMVNSHFFPSGTFRNSEAWGITLQGCQRSIYQQENLIQTKTHQHEGIS